MIKLIAIDLDDTLLNKNKEITKENIEAIHFVKNKGIKVVIASGRPFFRVAPILEQLDLVSDNEYAISYNGSYISNTTNNKVIKRNTLNNQDINNIIDEITKYNLTFTVYVDEDIYTSGISNAIINKPVFKGINFKIVPEDVLRTFDYANKIIIADCDELINKHVTKIKENLKDKYNVLKSATDFLEFLTIDSNKGKALKDLASYLEIKEEEMMSIGDEENDLPMFKEVKFKVAMENANVKLKEKATFITKDQEHSGVAFAIYSLIKND